MSDDINFLPEKEKEKKEREQVKKNKPGVKFHTPKADKQPSVDATDSSGFVQSLKDLIGGVFKKKKKIQAQQVVGKQPIKLTKETSGQKPSDGKDKKSEPTQEKTSSLPQQVKQQPISTASLTNNPPGLGGGFSQVDVNLMPWQDPLLKRVKFIRIAIIVVSVLVIATWGTVLRLQNSSIQEEVDSLKSTIAIIDGHIKEAQGELAGRESIDVGHQQAFVDLYSSLPHWSKFFTWLEGITHKEVSYANLTASNGSVVLPITAPDYDVAVQQWLAFINASDWAENVATSGFGGGTDDSSDEDVPEEVVYTVVFKLVDGVLLLSEEDL